MNSLRSRILTTIIVTTAIVLGAISYFNYQKASTILMHELTSAATNNAEHNANMVNEWLNGIIYEANALAVSSDVRSGEPQRFIPALKRAIEKHDDYSLIYVADNQGNSIGTSDKEFNVADRAYFQEAMQGKTVVSDPVMGKSTGGMVVVIATPVYTDNGTNPSGILGISVTLKHLQDLVMSMNLSGSGYGFIQNSDGTTIAHPDEKFWGNGTMLEEGSDDLTTLLQRMAAGEKGYGEYSFEGTEKMLAFAPVALTGWSVAQTADKSEVTTPLEAVRKANIMATLLAVIIMVGVSLIIAGFVTKPIAKLNQMTEAVAGGDLTLKVDVGGSNDEIGNLASTFNKMVDNLKNVITGLQQSSDKLAYHSQELASTSEEVSASLEEIASATNEVAATSAQGADNAEEAAKDSELLFKVAADGNQAVRETVEKINAIAQSSEHVSTAIQKLGEQSNRIGEIIGTITNIADQTNLLALNAAIEAARAGEHGRGFAVVADEVRKLAEQSGQSASEITGLVKEIQVGVGEVINAMEHGISEVREGVQVADNAGVSLEQISKAVERNTAMIKDVAVGAKQSNEATQQLTAANEQITSTVQQVSNAAQDLADIAVELQKTAVKFKV